MKALLCMLLIAISPTLFAAQNQTDCASLLGVYNGTIKNSDIENGSGFRKGYLEAANARFESDYGPYPIRIAKIMGSPEQVGILSGGSYAALIDGATHYLEEHPQEIFLLKAASAYVKLSNPSDAGKKVITQNDLLRVPGRLNGWTTYKYASTWAPSKRASPWLYGASFMEILMNENTAASWIGNTFDFNYYPEAKKKLIYGLVSRDWKTVRNALNDPEIAYAADTLLSACLQPQFAE